MHSKISSLMLSNTTVLVMVTTKRERAEGALALTRQVFKRLTGDGGKDGMIAMGSCVWSAPSINDPPARVTKESAVPWESVEPRESSIEGCVTL